MGRPRKAEVDEKTDEFKDRFQSLMDSELIGAIHKEHGEAILRLASSVTTLKLPRIPTGIYPLDIALGGGFPIGRISVVFGHKSSSKTTTLLKVIANAQKMCVNCYTSVVETGRCVCGNFSEFITIGSQPKIELIKS